jgi:SAM-dependent methyltransferase
VLDVGAAAGFVLRGFLDSGWRGRGIEPNPRMADHARVRLGLSVDVGTLEGYRRDERYDLVSMIQVVAHFYDLRKAFQQAARVTRPGGFWLVETWDRESWTARLLGKGWHEYSPPSVLHWFSPEGLKRLAEQFGLREVARGRPPRRIGGAHAKSLLRHKLKGTRLERLTSGLLGIIPDRLAVPYPGDDLFWALFQATGAFKEP